MRGLSVFEGVLGKRPYVTSDIQQNSPSKLLLHFLVQKRRVTWYTKGLLSTYPNNIFNGKLKICAKHKEGTSFSSDVASHTLPSTFSFLIKQRLCQSSCKDLFDEEISKL